MAKKFKTILSPSLLSALCTIGFFVTTLTQALPVYGSAQSESHFFVKSLMKGPFKIPYNSGDTWGKVFPEVLEKFNASAGKLIVAGKAVELGDRIPDVIGVGMIIFIAAEPDAASVAAVAKPVEKRTVTIKSLLGQPFVLEYNSDDTWAKLIDGASEKLGQQGHIVYQGKVVDKPDERIADDAHHGDLFFIKRR